MSASTSTYFQRFRERLKGYKTMVANILIGVPGALFYLYQEFVATGFDFTQYVPSKYVGLAVACMAILGVVMRIYTTGALGSKEGLPNATAHAVDDDFDPIKELEKSGPLK